MYSLSEDDMDVLALLAYGALDNPPPLVRGVAEQLLLRGLTYCNDGVWHATPFAQQLVTKYGAPNFEAPSH